MCCFLPLRDQDLDGLVVMLVVVVGVVLVMLVDGFWQSVKGSSMLSIVQACRGGLLSRHRAWGGREGEETGRREGRQRWRRHSYQARNEDTVSDVQIFLLFRFRHGYTSIPITTTIIFELYQYAALAQFKPVAPAFQRSSVALNME